MTNTKPGTLITGDIRVMGDCSATIAPVSAETVQPITPAKPDADSHAAFEKWAHNRPALVASSPRLNANYVWDAARADLLDGIEAELERGRPKGEFSYERNQGYVEGYRDAEQVITKHRGVVMPVDVSKIRVGDKVILRDGSKIIVDDRGGKLKPMVFMTYLTSWANDGTWSEYNPNCGFDIVGVIHCANRNQPE